MADLEVTTGGVNGGDAARCAAADGADDGTPTLISNEFSLKSSPPFPIDERER